MEEEDASREKVEDEIRWVKHYCTMHQILLVGEGDFSFSLSLAIAFGTASNVVATSHDSYATLLTKYSKAESNVSKLQKMGATVLHEIDATTMKLHVGLKMWKFDRIVFNFPHAGFQGKEDDLRLINLHRKLLFGFFKNASRMLRPYGEVHVTHKTGVPFCYWNLEELASKSSLSLTERADFNIKDYPSYNNKRGDGAKSDQPFPLGKCSTFKFRIKRLHKMNQPLLPRTPAVDHFSLNQLSCRNFNVENIPFAHSSNPQMQLPVSFERIALPSVSGTTGNLNFRVLAPPLPSSGIAPGASLAIMEPPRIRVLTELQEASRRVASGFHYRLQLDEVQNRIFSSLEWVRRMLVKAYGCEAMHHT
ncbi:Uncharacterized protein AXF42_Ash013721 [Apostasia shenzhenica]|uniref:25S rRNA (uridine-N(3))-methyltransferase BMT5-like domain-containing protein n=1 Tax=Apostasia shenzhenica TaxID=1088818 RepID=A0A2I0A4M5_9ASPA|nr:Uncharacterized protein AXF42_Ash013721 [Apostasia shenzhenica]